MTTQTPSEPSLDDFHCERSKCIDAFSALERAVVQLLGLSGTKVGTESFGQKLELLRNAKANPRLSKKRLETIRSHLARCAELNELRNDIVHAQLQLAKIDEAIWGTFSNNRYCVPNSQTARLFKLDGLKALRKEFSSLADQLSPTA